MPAPLFPRIEINSRPAATGDLGYRALFNYGHFTMMQVRSGSVRGLELHLRRLDAATRELFDTGLDAGLVRDHIRHALGGGSGDASVRVDIFRPEDDGDASVMVTVRAPAVAPDRPQALQAVSYQRPAAHIKHAGTFGQIYFGLRAERDGFDDALLTGPGGIISEAAISNIGFFDGNAVIWPDAPALPGITMQLLDQGLPAAGLRSRQATVRLADLPSFGGAFVSNSLGVTPVGRVDDLALPSDPERMTMVAQAYESASWDPI